MDQNNPRRLSDILEEFAPQGTNDSRWFLVEHQVLQARLSLDMAVQTLDIIKSHPENAQEREKAGGACGIIRAAYIDVLRRYSDLLSFLSDSDVLERIGNIEQ